MSTNTVATRAARSRVRTAWLTLGAAVSALSLICGGLVVWTWLLPHRTDNRLDSFRQPVTHVRLASNAGDVTVLASPGDEVTVERRLSWTSLTRPASSAAVSGDTLNIDGYCPRTPVRFGLGGDCRVDFTLRVPRGVAVDAHTEAGDVRAQGLSGDVRLASSTGDISVDGLSGSLWAHDDRGTITGTDLSGASADVEIDSGDIDLSYKSYNSYNRAPATVSALAGRGDVTVALPQGAYQVRAEADAGREMVDVTQDSEATSTVTAHTGAGDVYVRYTHQ